VRLQDDLLVGGAKVADLGHTGIPCRIPCHSFGAALIAKAIGIGRGCPGEGDGGRAVGVVIADLLASEANRHITVGIIAKRVSFRVGGRMGPRGKPAGVDICANAGIAEHIAARVVVIGLGGLGALGKGTIIRFFSFYKLYGRVVA